ncbi:hypothetical protein H0I76_07480 [Limibaculum sp. M0105]|uniref:Lipoprotein n=1 Tax=Thermohalobaculum xanthum TaxID=2753746 RepID=A0A8J7M5S6_9RHOB|nr:hypothetical protein [Thermohalobaculum xanthum]MBK0399026.1 hypothetical protein [Thermohalobaculum xanthum]
MTRPMPLAIGTVLLLALAACAPNSGGSGGGANQPASQPAPPSVGFSPDVSNAAVSACRNRLDSQTDGAIEVTGTEFSEANSAVYMVVGANRAPWRCLTSNRGEVAELMFIGDEGKL